MMSKFRLPALPREIDTQALLRICCPRLFHEVELVKARKAYDDVLKNQNSTQYLIAMKLLDVKAHENALKLIEREEHRKYHKKFGVTLDDDERKAKAGQDSALFRLITWHKGWLYKDWVRSRVLKAEAVDDSSFFEGLADALKSRQGKQRVMHKELVDYLNQVRATGLNFNNEEHVDAFWHWISLCLENESWDLHNISIFNDKNNFYKFLRRNGLR